MKIMISGHGGRWTTTAKFYLPQNVTVHFYVEDKKELSNNSIDTPNAWSIFENWFRNDTSDQCIVETFNGGDLIYDYQCWEMSDSPAYKEASGIFKENSLKVIPLERLETEANAESLQNIITRLNTNPAETLEIYWVCCRLES